ncbi:hypothetical protein ACUXPM_000432 [Ralstonia sp. 151470066-2]|nr:hypothetical protein [Ralstonia insidiosa]MBA9869434.1 hypothetical protein [Ralstonia insidiosa]MBA9912079.1 hypothetical protein [Ralstonia insidiosa]MBA9936546.1 hypothetical protein [Ralstonia insidiosa]MBA9950920.1 hypothetical protein [Ralstonia insidiosa]
MGTMRRGSAGLSTRLGWERHTAGSQVIVQVIPTRRRLFQTSRLPPTRIPVVLLWLLVISIAIGIGRVLLHRLW